MREKIEEFRRFLNSCSLAQNKVILISLIIVLLSIPLTVLAVLTYTTIFPRAAIQPLTPPFPPTPFPPKPTPTPIPEVSIILNSASGQTCDQICQQQNATCESIGTDDKSLNGYYVSVDEQKNCVTFSGFGCRQIMRTDRQKVCGGHITEWTNCRCLKISIPTPIPIPTPFNHPPEILTRILPQGRVFRFYRADVSAIDQDKDDLKMEASGLPRFLRMDRCSQSLGSITCAIFGYPWKKGGYQVRVKVTDSKGASTVKTLPLTIR